MKLSEAIENFMNYSEVMTSKGNYRYLSEKIPIINRYLGSFDVKDINRSILLKFIKEQRKRNPKISNATINKYIDVIKRILNSECDIVIKFDKLKQNKKTIRIVTEETINKIFNHYERNYRNIYTIRNYIYFRLLLETGLRINELLHVKVKDINFQLKSIHVKVTKTQEERYVFFSLKTKKLITLFIQKYNVKGYLLQSANEQPMTYEAVNKMLFRLKRRLNIEGSITPHKWRHTFATNYIMNGGDTASLQKLLGHKNLNTTEKYLHLNYDRLRKRYEEVMTPIY